MLGAGEAKSNACTPHGGDARKALNKPTRPDQYCYLFNYVYYPPVDEPSTGPKGLTEDVRP